MLWQSLIQIKTFYSNLFQDAVDCLVVSGQCFDKICQCEQFLCQPMMMMIVVANAICMHVITIVGSAQFAYGMNRKGGMQSSTVFPALNAKTEFAQMFFKQKQFILAEEIKVNIHDNKQVCKYLQYGQFCNIEHKTKISHCIKHKYFGQNLI